MSPPFFPIPIDTFNAEITFVDILPHQNLTLEDGLIVHTLPLNHPDSATGYRIEYKKKSICYITDVEHSEDHINNELCDFIASADYFIYDSTYTNEEYKNHKGWGHSTWQEGFRLAQKAKVKNYILFHHDPSHDDDFMTGLEKQIENLFPHTIIAKEGSEIEL